MLDFALLTMKHWVIIITGTLCFLPAFALLRYYQLTHITDYLLFAIVFLTSIPIFYTLVIRDITAPSVLVSQINDTAYNIFTFLLFIYVLRVKWQKFPKGLLYLGVCWFAIIQFLILFYELVPLPDNAMVLFWNMRKTPPAKDIGAAVITQGGTFLLGRGYFILADGFFFFVITLAAYVYLSIDLVVKDKRVKIARSMWVLAALAASIRPILLAGDLFFLWQSNDTLNNLCNFITAVSIAYVTLRYPETMVITYVQIIRVSDLYQQVQVMDQNRIRQSFPLSTLSDYLNKLPSEIKDELKRSVGQKKVS
ncbi:MAG: hypothetical protein ACXAC7_14600 [Candidatus Hodarchaeales archaeon]